MSSRTERDAEYYLDSIGEGLLPVDLDLYIAVTKECGHRRKNVIDMPSRLSTEEIARACIDYLYALRLERVREQVTPGREIVQEIAEHSTICHAWVNLYLNGELDWHEAVASAFKDTVAEISRLSELIDGGPRTAPPVPESTRELVHVFYAIDMVRREYVRLATQAATRKGLT